MPPLKTCRLAHIQSILAGRKKTLMQKDVPARHVPQWDELAVKVMYPTVINQLPEIIDYLPDPQGKTDKRLPDRDFFYKVLYTLYPEQTEDLIGHAANQRGPKGVNFHTQQW
jgi:hypothetical protein